VSGNRYLKIARLASHPAFSLAQAALACPLCEDFTTERCGEYDRHFLAHDPTQEQACEWLSWRTYERLAAKRGWPEIAEASAS
jgi:hypothetical protein